MSLANTDIDWVPAGSGRSASAVAAYRPAEYRIKLVTEAWEQREAASLRRAVFCSEQRLFDFSDADAIDSHALTLVAVSCMGGMSEDVVGTVRIHELSTGDASDDGSGEGSGTAESVWQGSRLAVRRDYRGQAWLGTELIHLAVSLAHARGATRFLAQVQEQNVALFERLHWQALERFELRGKLHCTMQADLAHYPPCFDSERGFVTLRKAAA